MTAEFVLMGVPAFMLTLLHWLNRLHAPRRSELCRKAAHVALGLVCLPLPWLGLSVATVGLLALIGLGLLLLIRKQPHMRQSFGPALYGVRRVSLGELCFPVAVGLTYLLAQDDALRYCLPMLLLTLADPAAALVGKRYGRGNGKSLAGSLAFFVVALLCSIGALLLAGLPLAAVAGAAVGVSLAATLIERLAGWGLDNLLIPLGSQMVLLLVLAG
ncbi:MAG: hypothetical protein HC911_14690 [Chloroflexaceae bacterium]|nr:hypothetical protein [Chloroflexaceae bacterium]